ncbi:TonB-dependent receptor [Massilia horti]|uniref:TonB-dependent receptor n=1 Tax=Massilia horti TaxID=2562153 RepID=UPI001430923F|nr:TonB-dependent receptor [Massilia horti]
MLANGDDLAGKTTKAIQGSFPVKQALDAMLAGTGLIARMNPGGSVLVQPGKQPDPLPRPTVARESARPAEMPQVLVVGTRASQQSSIELKKYAATLRDSIVAEDVSEFPDRNVAEAISRLAGVTLERGEYGEGTTINVRGHSAIQTRVEIDGLGVQAGGGTDLNNGGSGRGVELRELPADLIKSIDVVKGATADMTEGSLGGAVIIHTRTGLDFKKQYVALRVAGQQNSINEKWTPNLNFVFADKFLDNRLGVVLNLSSSAARNENHTVNISPLANGMARTIDFDQSPEKTFSYNPSTVSKTDPASTAPMARWGTTGGGTFDSLSPLEIVTRSAAAASKEDCYAAFPLYTSAEVASISSSVNRAAAKSQRAYELRSCLNQWNDYTPQNLRYQMRRQFDRRVNGDLRLDFKVNNQLSVYAKFDRNKRRIDDDQLFLSLGSISINPDGSYVDTGASPNIVRTPVPGSGYYFYPSPSNLGASGSTYRGLTNGSVVNVMPSSLKVDANHHVTQYTLSNATLNNDQIYDQIETTSSYTQFGGSWRSGRWRAQFLAGRAKASETRMQWRTNFSFPYGPATVSVAPNGVWTYALAPGVTYDQKDYSNYGILLPQNGARLPMVSAATALTLANPRAMARSEDTARLDMSYAADGVIPYIGQIKFGLGRRDYAVSSWSGSGYTVQPASGATPAIVVPRVAQSSSFQACENTPASLAPGGTPCRYGTTTSSNPASLNSTIVMTQAAYRDIVAQVLTKNTIPYFNSLPNRPAGLPSGWTQIDVRKVIELTGVQNFNLDCVQFCTGSDGKLYEQPRTGVFERVLSGYLSTDFEFDRIPFTSHPLPFGWELGGNFGWRVVRTEVAATGLMTFQSISKTATYDPQNPTAATGISTATLTRNTAMKGATNDVMPILNLAWWPLRDRLVVRYNKAKAIARPPIEYLYSNGVTCTYDERKLGVNPVVTDASGMPDMSCDDTLGNPGLRAATNRNYNLALEWYPNRSSMLSLTRFRQQGIVGAPIRVAVSNGRPFAYSGTNDPVSGRDLSDVRYTYATYVNGPANERDGFELSTKAAFTILPWRLRYTGLDLNYTHAKSTSLEGAVRDLITGDVLPPPNELAYTWNASLWYDDGKFQARVALQGAAAFFRGFTTASHDYPAKGVTGDPALPFNPGTPTFRDARRFVDAKVSYKFENGIELFAEGRNLGRAAVTNSQGAYVPFADGTPNLLDYSYSGAQYMVGVTFRH